MEQPTDPTYPEISFSPTDLSDVRNLTPQRVASIREVGFGAGNAMSPGRPKGVKYVSELIRMMLAWPIDYVKKVAEDPTQPMGARIAACQVLLYFQGDDKVADRIMERVEGKTPLQGIEIENAMTAASTGKKIISPDTLRNAHAKILAKKAGGG